MEPKKKKNHQQKDGRFKINHINNHIKRNKFDTPIKKHKFSDCIKNKIIICCLKYCTLNIKTNKLNKNMKNTIPK